MQKKLYLVCFKKTPHLSNVIDPAEPAFFKIQVSTAFFFREEQYEFGVEMLWTHQSAVNMVAWLTWVGNIALSTAV